MTVMNFEHFAKVVPSMVADIPQARSANGAAIKAVK